MVTNDDTLSGATTRKNQGKTFLSESVGDTAEYEICTEDYE